MKNCIIDIDLLFLDSAGVVTTVHRMKAEGISVVLAEQLPSHRPSPKVKRAPGLRRTERSLSCPDFSCDRHGTPCRRVGRVGIWLIENNASELHVKIKFSG
jgi:hypothetical protein